MIADIDFRWVKRQDVRSKTPTFDDTFPMEKVEIEVLQFRTHKIFGNSPMFVSDWQDVPVVEE